MQTRHHHLKPAVPGTAQSLLSLHFGTPGTGPKVAIQASLHADEAPGMLVAHHLRQRLVELEAAGSLRGEVVLVPAANPIGLGQWTLRGWQGRFEQASGENFNRNYADLSDAVLAGLPPPEKRPPTPEAWVALLRQGLRQAVAARPVNTALDSLRQALYSLAIDADLVLDLHCDGEATLHFYTTPGCWPGLRDLAALMGAEPVLLAEESGGEPFDEACSMIWPKLAQRLGLALPQACEAVTIELRGEADVSHALAAQDAEAILQFLTLRGVVDGPAPTVPALRCEATPLAGSIPLPAPHGGVIVFARRPGGRVLAGELLVELLDPFTGQSTPIHAPVDGLFFARDNRRFAVAGMSLGKVAGRDAQRRGALLSP